MLAEAEPGGTQDEKVAWVYFTFVEARRGGEQALSKSNAFKNKQLWFRVWMVALDDTRHAKDEDAIPGFSETPVALRDYVASRYFQQAHQPRADGMVKVVRAMYATPSNNPYQDVTNQGSAGYGPGSDINRTDEPWHQARLYYWLGKCGELVKPPSGLTVEIITAKNSQYQTVLINANAIRAYFKEHPEQLKKDVNLYTAENDRKPPCTPKPAKAETSEKSTTPKKAAEPR